MAKGKRKTKTKNELRNTTQKAKDWVRRTPQKTGGELILHANTKYWLRKITVNSIVRSIIEILMIFLLCNLKEVFYAPHQGYLTKR